MIKVGETITDGEKIYVFGSDKQYHYVTSGNHAEHHVSKAELKELIKS